MTKRDWIVFQALHFVIVDAIKHGEIIEDNLSELLSNNTVLDRALINLDQYNDDEYLEEIKKAYAYYTNKIKKEIEK